MDPEAGFCEVGRDGQPENPRRSTAWLEPILSNGSARTWLITSSLRDPRRKRPRPQDTSNREQQVGDCYVFPLRNSY